MANAETNLNALHITNPEESIQLKATLGNLYLMVIRNFIIYKKKDEEQSFSVLDNLNVGDEYLPNNVQIDESFTSPPSRYTDASLVKKLEELDIGRPSTYASIIQVIQSRGYVIKNGKSFYLNDRGRVVNVFFTIILKNS